MWNLENGDRSDISDVICGEPYAGKLHVRFDEGAGVPDNKGRSALLYTPLYSVLRSANQYSRPQRRLERNELSR